MHTLAVVEQHLDYGALVAGLLKNPLVWVTLLTSFAIPFLNAAITHVSTVPLFKSLVTGVLAGATALAAWLTNLGGDVDWKVALGVFVAAAAGAGGVNAAIAKGPIADKLSRAIPINVGPKLTPEKADAKHSNGAGLTEPVPNPAGTLLPAQVEGLPAEYL